MNFREESLDKEFLGEEQPFNGQLESVWSHIALACIGFEVVLFLSSFSSSFDEKIMDVRTIMNILNNATAIYLLWYIKLVCNRLLNVSTVDLPIYVLIVLSFLQFGFYFIELDYSNPYHSILTSLRSLLLLLCMAWLIVALLRLKQPNSLFYLRLWAFAIIIRTVANTVLPIFIYSGSMEIAEYQQKITAFIELLPELTFLFLILTEQRLNVVKTKATI